MEVLEASVESWTLESDVKLLQYLQDFSNDVQAKSKDILNNVDGLLSEATEAKIRLNNTFNEFLILANTQFIENRVYDDDEVEETPQPTTSDALIVLSSGGRTVEEAMPMLKQAVQYGFEALRFFDDVDTTTQESAEDIYNARPLPYIIGTQAFLRNKDAGLGDVFEDDEEEGAQGDNTGDYYDQYEQTPEEGDYSREASENGRSISAEDYQHDSARGQHHIDDGDDNTDEGTPTTERLSQMDFRASLASQLASRTKSGSADIITDRPSGSEPAASASDKAGVKEQDVEQDNSPNAEEEEDPGLFGRHDDPFGLFGPSRTSAHRNSRDQFSDLFAGSRTRSDSVSSVANSLFGGQEGGSGGATDAPTPKGLNKHMSYNVLFGDLNDEHLFDEPSPSSTTQSKATASSTKTSTSASSRAGLFDDPLDEPESKQALPVVTEKPELKTTRSVDTAVSSTEPAVDSPSSGSQQLFRGATTASLFGDGGLFGDTSGGSLFDEQAAETTTSHSSVKQAGNFAERGKKFASLFGGGSLFDEEEEPLPSTSSGASSTQAAEQSKSSNKASSSLLFDEPSPSSALSQTPKPSNRGGGLFDDPLPTTTTTTESKTSSLFGGESSSAGSVPTEAKAPTKTTKSSKGASLFDADDDLLAAPSAKPAARSTSKPRPAAKFGGLFDDDFDTVTSAAAATATESKPADTTTATKPKATGSLFDDNNAATTSPKAEAASTKPSSGLSDEPNPPATEQPKVAASVTDKPKGGLFDDVPAAKPSSGLFAEVNPPTAEPSKVVSPAVATAKGGLFDDEKSASPKAVPAVVEPTTSPTKLPESKTTAADASPASPQKEKGKKIAGLANKLGLDPSKMLPGMGMPPKFAKPASEDKEEDDSTSSTGEINNAGTLQRATVSGSGGRKRRAPTMKRFQADEPAASNNDNAKLSASAATATSTTPTTAQASKGGLFDDVKPTATAVPKRGLFDDVKQPINVPKGSLFDDATPAASSKATSPKSATPTATTKSALFGDEPAVAKPSQTTTAAPATKAAPAAAAGAKQASSSSGLFGDPLASSGSGGGLFGDAPSPASSTSSASSKAKSGDLFGDSPKPKATATTAAPAKQGLFDSGSSSLFGDEPPAAAAKPQSTTASTAAKKKAVGLFDSGSSDLFGDSSTSPSAAKSSAKPVAQKKGLFDDDPLMGGSSRTKGLFDD